MLENYIAPIFVSIILIQAFSFILLVFLRQISINSERLTICITYLSLMISTILTIALAVIAPRNHIINLGEWFGDQDYKYELIFTIDLISITYALFSLILTGIIASFSRRYLHREGGFYRFYISMIIFILGVLIVSFAATLEIIVVGWELVGLSSVLLVSFFNYRNSPIKNGFWVFVNYRICDIGLFLAVLSIHSFSHNSVFVPLQSAPWLGISNHHMPLFIGFCIFFSAIGKSALFPLSGWLPRAMEGPTPSSAIFYGAISVHLGALLLLRCFDLIAANSLLAVSITVIGIITAIFGRVIGSSVNDIKGSLAYGSITQLGLIVAEIGFGWNNLALIHIIGHSGFRTLQILRAPNLLHDRHQLEQMLGHHISVAYDQRNEKYSNLEYPFYRFLLERGFVDNFLKDFVVGKILSIFHFIDQWEEKLTKKILKIGIVGLKSKFGQIWKIIIFKIGLIAILSVIACQLLSLTASTQTIILFIAFLLIVGLFPFQSWYIKCFEILPLWFMAIIMLLQSLLIWTSKKFYQIYNIEILHSFLAVAALISSFMAISQNNVRRLLPYLIGSQMAFLAFSSISISKTVNMGSNYLFLALFASCAFVMLINALEKRQGELKIARPCGNYDSYPRLSVLLFLFGLTASCFPLSVSYIAEDLIFEGSFDDETIIDIIWIIAIAINNITVVKIFLYLCQGTSNYEKNLDLKNHETIIYSALMICLIVFSVIA